MSFDITRAVKEFQKKFGYPVRETPTTEVPAEEIKFRMRLIAEEFCEMLEAVYGGGPNITRVKEEIASYLFLANPAARVTRVDLSEVADALADLAYVIEGTNLSFGIPSGAVLEEVHRSNMAKEPSHLKAADERKNSGNVAKAVKPEGWTPPDIEGVLRGFSEYGSEDLP